MDFQTEKVSVKEVVIKILPSGKGGDAPIRVSNGWQYVDALRVAETPSEFPLRILVEDDITVLKAHLGTNKGVFTN